METDFFFSSYENKKKKQENTLREQYRVMNEGIDMNIEHGYWILDTGHWTLNITLDWVNKAFIYLFLSFYVGWNIELIDDIQYQISAYNKFPSRQNIVRPLQTFNLLLSYSGSGQNVRVIE